MRDKLLYMCIVKGISASAKSLGCKVSEACLTSYSICALCRGHQLKLNPSV